MSERQGYQPTVSSTDASNPPQGGSGVPPHPPIDLKAAEIAKLDLLPGDVVVLLVPDRLSRDALKRLRESWQEAFDGATGIASTQCLVLDGGMRIEVLRPTRGVS